MSWVLTLAIRLYWLLVPAAARRACLFRESCSRLVFRLAQERGTRAALGALRVRVRECRHDYAVELGPTGQLDVRLASGRLAPAAEMAEDIFRPFQLVEADVAAREARRFPLP